MSAGSPTSTADADAALPIDAVVLWVDGDDPVLKRKREAYLARSAADSTLSRRAVLPTRFSATFELEFNLRLLRGNAPWLRTIFLVTDNQRPDWLDDQYCARWGVRVVDHVDVFRGYEQALPVFNSRSIETLLFNIPGLAERFIYLNDDFFLLRPTETEDWFVDGDPVVRAVPFLPGAWHRFVRKTGRRLARRCLGGRYCGGELGLGAEKRVLRGHSDTLMQLYHTPFALRQSVMRQVMTENGLDRGNIRYRFRSDHQVKPIVLTQNLMLYRNQAVLSRRRDWYYINGEKHGGRTLSNRLQHCRNDGDIKMLCINSIDQMSEPDQSRVRAFLQDHTERAET